MRKWLLSHAMFGTAIVMGAAWVLLCDDAAAGETSVRVQSRVEAKIGTGQTHTIEFEDEVFDNGDMHDLAESTRLYAPCAGSYIIYGNVAFKGDTNARSVGFRDIAIKKAGGVVLGSQRFHVNSGGGEATVALTTHAQLAEKEYVELTASVLLGAANTSIELLAIGPPYPIFGMVKLGPPCVPALPTCNATGGVDVGGFCWFLGGNAESCDDVCTNNGLVYNAVTRSYAGDDAGGGNEQNCHAVLRTLSAGSGAVRTTDCLSVGFVSPGLGCIANNGRVTNHPQIGVDARVRCDSDSGNPDPTTSSAVDPLAQRACACQ